MISYKIYTVYNLIKQTIDEKMVPPFIVRTVRKFYGFHENNMLINISIINEITVFIGRFVSPSLRSNIIMIFKIYF